MPDKIYIADKPTLDETKTNTDTIIEMLEQVPTDIAGIKTDVAGVKEDIGTVKTDVAGVKTDVGSVKTDVAGVKEDTSKILTNLSESRPKRYGFRVKMNEPNPDNRVEYVFDAVGMEPAKMDFDGDSFNYGDWKDIWFVRDNYPVMLKPDGTEDYLLDPNDYTKKASDGSDSKITDSTQTSNAMSAIPLCWVKRYQEGGYQYVIFCESQYDSSYKAYAHTRADGSIGRVAYHAIYKGVVINSALRSLSGQYPGNLIAAQAEIDATKKTGSAFTIRTWSLQCLIADLCTLISKSMASQAVFGHGHQSGYVNDAAQHYGLLQSGTLDKKGQFFGFNDDTSEVKVFHIEGFWANRWDRLVGLIYRNGEYLVKMTPEGSGYNLTGDGYTPVGIGITGQTAASGSGWQQNTVQTEYGRFPIAPFTGSDATYETDFFWFNNTITAVALAGGDCNCGSRCGARFLLCDSAASWAFWALGASLSSISFP